MTKMFKPKEIRSLFKVTFFKFGLLSMMSYPVEPLIPGQTRETVIQEGHGLVMYLLIFIYFDLAYYDVLL